MEGWKRCTALLAAALLSLSFAACGKDGGGDITPTKLEGMVKEAYDGTDYSAYLGIWDGVVNDGEPEQKLIAAPDEDGEPRWVLYVGGELACSGFLQVRPQYANAVYAYVEQEGCGYLCWFDSYGALHIELDLDGNSCVLVPEGTVPGWQTDGGDVAGADWRTSARRAPLPAAARTGTSSSASMRRTPHSTMTRRSRCSMPPWTITPPYRATRGRRFRASTSPTATATAAATLPCCFRKGTA